MSYSINNNTLPGYVDNAIDVMQDYSNQQSTAQYEANKDLMTYAMQYNANEAKLNREFQERMSNTQYQRAVADLEKAGLNKLLAYSNLSGSVPQGSVASTSASSVSRGSDLNSLLSALVSNANTNKRLLVDFLGNMLGVIGKIFGGK